jgi:hypothetical protein
MNMATATNWFFTEYKALNERTKALVSASGDVTYTAKTGRVADDFQTDRFIRVTTGSTFDMAITVPDGVAYGQKLDVLFEVEGGTDTVDVTTTTGDNGTQLTAAGGYNRFEWHGSTIGWVLISSSAT